MITTKKELNFFIAADRIMAGKPPKPTFRERFSGIITPSYTLKYLCSMRHVEYYTNTKNKKNFIKHLFHKRRFSSLGAKLGFSIGLNTFGYGLLIPHHGTIVINGSTRAGNFCVLHTSTCIGGTGKTIGDALYLSTGALIMGTEVILGDNVSVGANSLVNRSENDSNILLVGNPASIKATSLPWYKRDGEKYMERVRKIESLKKESGL